MACFTLPVNNQKPIWIGLFFSTMAYTQKKDTTWKIPDLVAVTPSPTKLVLRCLFKLPLIRDVFCPRAAGEGFFVFVSL